MKNQMECYRTIKGVRWPNWLDVLSDDHEEQIKDARKDGKRLALRRHPDGYYQAFIHPDDL